MLCEECDPTYTVEYIESLQEEIHGAMAKYIKKYDGNRKNDLGYIFDTTDYTKLSVYNKILDQVKYCNSCFGSQDISSIVSRIKTLISKIK